MESNTTATNTFEGFATGSILGAFVGDATGGHREFAVITLTDEEMAETMSMPGGGPWNKAPGQITDDSELAMCLLWGLINSEDFAVQKG